MPQIERAQEVVIGIQFVFVVDVVLRQPAQPVGLLGLDDSGQPLPRECLVTYKIDRRNAGAVALVDGKDDIDAVVGKLLDPSFDLGAAAALRPVVFLDVENVRLQLGVGQHTARLQLDDRRQNVGFDLLVALEDHRIDDRVLDNRDNQHAAALDDADVGKQARCIERLDRCADIGRAVGLAGLDGQVGLDRLGFDTLVALDLNAGGNRGMGDSRAKHGNRAAKRRQPQRQHQTQR